MRALLLIFLPGVCLAGLAGEWAEYKARWGKVYTGPEEVVRRSLWEGRRLLVTEHNSRGLTYRLALDEASDWTEEEVEGRRLGYQAWDGQEEPFGGTFMEMADQPDALDHRDAGLVTGVKNQGHCGSCWAFSATGGIEGVWARMTGELVSVSEQQLVDCAPGSCQGGNMSPAWNWVRDHGGIMTEADYPYQHKDGECRFNASQAVASVTGHHTVAHTEQDLEAALYQVGYPISIAIHAGATFHHYSQGVYSDPDCVEGKLNHAVLLVGYNKTGAEPYWIVKNSWGGNWGQGGYIHMAMGENSCGLANRPVYPVLEI